MRALLVVESMFGNTRAVADAVAEGLAEVMPVEVVEVARGPGRPEDDVTLLVVGGPTHTWTMSRAGSREDARGRGATGSAGPGLREWLRTLEPGDARDGAAFCTRIRTPFSGSAAGPALRRLERLGLRRLVPPEDFLVHGMSGPMVEGELARARRWGRAVGAAHEAAVGRTA